MHVSELLSDKAKSRDAYASKNGLGKQNFFMVTVFLDILDRHVVRRQVGTLGKILGTHRHFLEVLAETLMPGLSVAMGFVTKTHQQVTRVSELVSNFFHGNSIINKSLGLV